MRNKSRSFFIGLVVIVITLTTLSFYYLKKSEIVPSVESFRNSRTYSLNTLLIANEVVNNPDYEPLVFDPTVDPIIVENIKDNFKQYLMDILEYAKEDKNFEYSYVSKNVSQTNVIEMNGVIHDTIIIGSNGIKLSGDSINTTINSEEVITNSNYHVDYLPNVDKDNEQFWRWNIHKLIELNYPDEGSLSINITDISADGYFTSVLINEQVSQIRTLFTLVIFSSILCLFIILVNFEYEKNAPFFRVVKSTRLELGLIVYITISFVLGASLVFLYLPLLKNSLNQIAQYLQLSEELMPYILDGICILITTMFYFSVATLMFYIKSILKAGIIKSIRFNSYFGLAVGKVKSAISNGVRDFSNTKVMKYIGIFIANNLVCYALYGLQGMGLVIMILYIALILRFGVPYIKQILDDYRKLENKADGIANGNFDTAIIDKNNTFESVSRKLDSVRNGFEAAVLEEVKSQNEKNELITNISHDLKTPLTALQNYAVLLKDESISDEKRVEYIEKVNEYIRRLGDQVEGIFEISKINSGVISLEPIELDIVALLKQSLFEFENVIESQNLSLVIDESLESVNAYLDPEKTHRIFDNIISNICKYSLEGTRIYIGVEVVDKTIKISFKNISKVPMNFTEEEITQRFVRGDKSRSEVGSGVGLAIVKNLTEVQGGIMDIVIDGDLFKLSVTFEIL